MKIDCFDVAEEKVIDVFASYMGVVDSCDNFVQSGDFGFEVAFLRIFDFKSGFKVIDLFVESDDFILLFIEDSGIIQKSCS